MEESSIKNLLKIVWRKGFLWNFKYEIIGLIVIPNDISAILGFDFCILVQSLGSESLLLNVNVKQKINLDFFVEIR